MKNCKMLLAITSALMLPQSFAFAADSAAAAQAGKPIEDNSFLLEEAYNQEPGVIQHIQAFQYMKDKTWGYSFTEEWPVPGETHQLSFTLPVTHLSEGDGLTGVGDLLLNYRYQLLATETVAMAPRLSAVVPTGDYKKGLGTGAVGVQTNLPLSVVLSPKWVTHWNLGATFIPSAKSPEDLSANTLSINYGASFIYLLSQSVNLMLEIASYSNEVVQSDGTTAREDAVFLNPGVRFALNFDSGLQIVPGISAPIGIGPSSGERGVLFYLSFEHPAF